jgi:phosphoenolpyruvate carboxykinase (GTP)
MQNNPALDPAADDPAGVPINAIVFGGRRSRVVPLVFQAFNWIHGVYLGATLGSEATAAAVTSPNAANSASDSKADAVPVRRDPMAMLPFLGYNIRDYLVHWIRMRRKMADCPRIFHVNWFRKGPDGRFLWPGYGQNMRVLKWIIDRCHGRAYAVESIIGWMPRAQDFDLEGLSLGIAEFEQIQHIDQDEVKAELLSQEELFLKIAGDLPKEMIFQRELLISRL